MPFQLLTMTPAKLASVNPRSERHGPEKLVPAIDLRIQMERSNDILDAFDPALHAALYFKAKDPTGQQKALDGMEHSAAPNLRFPKLAVPLKWDQDLTGMTMTIDPGLGGRSMLTLTDCTVSKFAIEPKEGGTVSLAFTVSCAGDALTEKVQGRLCQLVQHELDIQLEPPNEAQTDIEGKGTGAAPPASNKPAAKSAGQAFADAHS